jgi:tetratricopeptide (TPR) repeat protein
MPSVGRRRLLAIAVLVFLTIAAFAGALGNDFVWDDRGYILDTPELRYPQNITLLLDPELYFTRFQEGSWRPVVTLSHFLEVGAFGYWAPGHNTLDLFLYTLVIGLVFVTALRMGTGERAAFLAAALFAVHPVHVEPVVVSTLRDDVLCALFMLLAFMCLIKADGKDRGMGWWAGSLGFFALGLLSKEVALVFPLLVLAYDVARWKQRDAGMPEAASLARRYGALLALTGAYAALRFGLFAGPPRSIGYIGGTPGTAAVTMLGLLTQYMRLFFFPLRLSADYLVRPVESLASPRALLGLGVLAILISATIHGYRRRPLLGFGLAFFLISLLPVCNLVPLDNPLAERYLFVPSIGLCWALGLLGGEVLEQVGRRGRPVMTFVSWGAVGVVIVGLGLRTAARTRDWRDEITLWQATVAASPDSARAHSNLGSALLLEGKWDRGREEVEKALALRPDSFEALHNLGLIRSHEGDWLEAEKAYRQSLALQPDAPPTLYNLARALAAQGKRDEALGFLNQAVARKPLFAEAYVLMGNLLMEQGDGKKAVDAYRMAIEAEPEGSLQAYTNLGNAERALGNLEEAESAYRRAIKLKPTSALAHFNLASLYGQQGRYRETIVELERAVKADPGMIIAHKNLGLLYLKVLRDSGKARRHLQRVLELAPDHPDAPAIREIIERLPPS